VEELGMKTMKHLKPYKFKWVINCGEVMNEQVNVALGMGDYKDEMICDMFPMHVGEFLLKRPWMFDREVMHNERRNTYGLSKEGKKFTLLRMSPSEVMRDKIILREKEK
jgi:hypothetical protein